MGDRSGIEWCEATWNVVVGCSVVSPGCTNCYAMRQAGTRLAHLPRYAGLTQPSKAGPVWTGELRFVKEALEQPLRWKRPRMIFVNSMSDLFHGHVSDEWIDKVFAVMALAPQHTFQVLTKRSSRMRAYMTAPDRKRTIAAEVMYISELRAREAGTHKAKIKLDHFSACFAGAGPFRNIWLGVSCEDQARADERIPDLLATPAAVRFVSAEPLLSGIDFTRVRWKHPNPPPGPAGLPQVVDALTGKVSHYGNGRYFSSLHTTERLDWVIVGGENGPRPMHPAWAHAIRDQCASAGISFFFKQWGTFGPRGLSREAWLLRPDGTYDPDLRPNGIGRHHKPGYATMYRVGKKAAGRMLDGREHNDMPAPGTDDHEAGEAAE